MKNCLSFPGNRELHTIPVEWKRLMSPSLFHDHVSAGPVLCKQLQLLWIQGYSSHHAIVGLEVGLPPLTLALPCFLSLLPWRCFLSLEGGAAEVPFVTGLSSVTYPQHFDKLWACAYHWLLSKGASLTKLSTVALIYGHEHYNLEGSLIGTPYPLRKSMLPAFLRGLFNHSSTIQFNQKLEDNRLITMAPVGTPYWWHSGVTAE